MTHFYGKFSNGFSYMKHKTNELALPRRLSNRKHQRMKYLQFFHHRAYGTNKKPNICSTISSLFIFKILDKTKEVHVSPLFINCKS